MIPEDGQSKELQQELIEELRRGNELAENLLRMHRDWRIALRNGLLTGFGGVVGATILVSLAIWILQPLRHLQVFGPALERIADELEKGRTRGR